MIQQAIRYAHTAKHFRASQVGARIRLLLRRRTWHRSAAYLAARYEAPAGVRVASTRFRSLQVTEAASPASALDELRSGTFRLLNSVRALGRPVDWTAPDTTRLWRYNLHYFEYAPLLVRYAAPDSPEAECLRGLIREWIAANPLAHGVGWHAYPVARRIVNWVQAAAAICGHDRAFDEGFGRSLYQQAAYLDDHLEYDSLGNHLLADGKALVFAGLCLGGGAATNWTAAGERILRDGLDEQILSDGGHYERAPMYHALVLQDYLETVVALRDHGRPEPANARPVLIAMADLLHDICHPDGEIPLFGDSAFGIVTPTRDLLRTAEQVLDCEGRWMRAADVPAGRALLETGYVSLPSAERGTRLVADVAPIGPSHIPAHTHCSLLSYELSLGGHRLIVDSGVEEYEPGPWRDYWRSTRAHNTVAVDGAEQSEIWASFRAGRRASVVALTQRVDALPAHVAATVRAFPAAGWVEHSRWIVALPGGVHAVIDRVDGEGGAPRLVESFVHVHPSFSIRVDEDGARIDGPAAARVRAAARPAAVVAAHVSGATDPVQGWYAPRFGERQPAAVLVLSARAALPVEIGYLIVPSGVAVGEWSWSISPAGTAAMTLDLAIMIAGAPLRATVPLPRKSENPT